MNNIMSYYYTFNHFSNGQVVRSRNAFATSSLLQQVIGICFVSEIDGPETVCNSSGTTYTLVNGGNSATWNVSSNLTILSQNQNSIAVKPITSSTSGYAFIEAVLPSQIIRKDIWVGKPKIELKRNPKGLNYVYLELVGDDGTDINEQGITSTSWKKISGSGSCYAGFGGGGFKGLGHGNCNSWSVYAKITATNPCGTTTIYRTITPPAPPPPPPSTCRDTYYRMESPSRRVYRMVIEESPCDDWGYRYYYGKTRSSNPVMLYDSRITALHRENNVKILVYDLSGDKVLESNGMEFDLYNQKPGICVIKAFVNDKNVITYKVVQ